MIDVLKLEDIRKTFFQGRTSLVVLNKANLKIQGGEMVGLIGPSGSGKSTLLQIAGLLENAEEGRVSILGVPMNKLDDNSRTKARGTDIGFVYQYHHLLAEFTALENIVLPQLISGKSKTQANNVANKLLASMQLSDRSTHRPARLSGGEQQRVAVARALANGPRLLLADEPTGNLDHDSAEQVFNLLVELVKKTGVAALIATHNPELAGKMDRVLRLENGILVPD
ncbi:MAG TPA: ABC transporter ATP-binding protein [Rhodospirillales bacterium]|nr:MAG: Lipoprotein-releasing system ATP-binding protein LolD [Alphaproteobacteria bacterium MarineAlpha3_Bin6]HHZ76722.1 ABC transporter ATP-binding protein [Rhodospirillales bacterium]HIA81165.1 ABC transporter ATP-binding protein [Rhodospirillales bacterium]HIB21854.1 ABC transporter ATP-binding protein [Rhodospirillales bacterium]HIC59582.1 ABC transporter ATP-binding protein [Rhodospirillales bacterium]|tara:strand:- start:1027 stop:1704 length:678 start_codon:yes stop_codon:yes gene_type:complete